MNMRHLMLGMIAMSAVSACGPVKLSPADQQASADQRAIERRQDDELLRLCRMMSQDDPRYRSSDCKNRIQVAR